MVCFIRCAPVSEDIRLKKYILACQARNVELIGITWDRMKRGVKEDYEIQFQMLAPYGNRYKNAVSRIIWQFFVLFNLLRNKKKYAVIHVTNFENIFPALLTKFFLGKKIIYDIYDSSSNDWSSKLFTRFMKWLDKRCIKESDVLILPAKERLVQMNLQKSDYKRFFEVENVPNITESAVAINNLNLNSIKLSYVGDFDYSRGIEEFLKFVDQNENFELQIAGRGALKNLVEQYSSKNPRIVYHGQIAYETGLKIMKESDFIFGMYYTKNGTYTNHIYAAPNKFCESLYLAKPLITTKNTLVGKNTEIFNTGYAIGESLHDLEQLFQKYSLENPSIVKEYEEIIRNAASLWNDKYKSYFENVLKTDYVNMVTTL